MSVSSISFSVDSREYTITKETDPLLFKYISRYDDARQKDFYVVLHRDRGLKDTFKISPTLPLVEQLQQHLFAKEYLSKKTYVFYIENKMITSTYTALGMLLKSGVVITGRENIVSTGSMGYAL